MWFSIHILYNPGIIHNFKVDYIFCLKVYGRLRQIIIYCSAEVLFVIIQTLDKRAHLVIIKDNFFNSV